VNGDAGDGVGYGMCSTYEGCHASITVKGDAGRNAGLHMGGGEIYVDGKVKGLGDFPKLAMTIIEE
jgi:formylmethanofuran dehydrogenase subunit C